MQLRHVNLVVRDPELSARFYIRHVLPSGSTVWLGNSLHVRSGSSDLAFQAGEPHRTTGAHHGFIASSSREIEALAQQLQEAGVSITEDSTENGFRAIKFLDPDGYECEVYWEADWP
jgi:catechol 2,3-dioxygenase-like lactoylglutathione lyase family enzyme